MTDKLVVPTPPVLDEVVKKKVVVQVPKKALPWIAGVFMLATAGLLLPSHTVGYRVSAVVVRIGQMLGVESAE